MARSRNRIGESGNIFFTLFGAVALVGIVGVATSTLMRGPMGTVITLNQKAKVDAQLQIARKLVGLASARAWQAAKANGTACDADAVIAPIAPATAACSTYPSGGGCLPATIGAAKTDPWGTMVGYCAWDHGFNTSDCGLLAGETNLALVGEKTVFAVISAGPDRKFETTCNDSPDYVTKGGDDIVFEWTYDEAAAGLGGGLWTLDSSQTARPDASVENLEISKPTTFASGATTQFNDSAAFGHGSRLDLSAGGIFNLPTQSTLPDSDCTPVTPPTPPSPNDGVLRRYTLGGGQVVQICDSLHGGWVDVGGSGAGGLAKGAEGDVQFNSGGDLYATSTFNFDKVTGKLTVGGGTGTALDVKGDAAFSNDVTIARDLTVSDNLTVTKEAFFKEDVDFSKDIISASGDVSIDDTLLVSGDSEFKTNLKVDGNSIFVGTIDAQGAISNSTGDVTVADAFTVSGANLTTLSGDLNVNKDVDIDGDTNMDGQLLVNGKAAGASFEIGAIDSGEGMYSNGASGLSFKTSGSTAMEIDTSGDIGIGLTSGPTADLDIGGFMRLRGSGQVAGTACGAIPGAVTYSSGDELLVCSSVTNNWETIGTSGGGGGGASDWWKKETNILRYEHSSYIVDEGATLPVSGSGTRLVWYPAKAGFRVGSVSGTQWDDGNIGTASVAMGEDLQASGANSAAFGKSGTVSGGNSFGIFMGGQSGADISSSNIFGVLGGKMVVDADGSQTSPHGALSLDVEGKVGATQYCSELDNFCFTAEDVASGQLGAPGDETQIVYHSGGVLWADPGLVFAGGALGINVTAPIPANLKANVIGDVGATQYCDENGLNCFTAASIAGGALADPADDREIFFNSGGRLETMDGFTLSLNGAVATPSGTGSFLSLGSFDAVHEGAEIDWAPAGSFVPWVTDLYDNNFRFVTNSATSSQIQMYNAGAGKVGLYVQGALGVGTNGPNAQFDNAGSTALSGDIPGALTANTNDWSPAGLDTASVIRMTSTADVDLTGLAGGVDGRIISLMNVGSNVITLKPNAAGSAAANRFAMTGDLPLAADQTVVLMYDATTNIWRHLANSTSMGSINVLAIDDLTDAITDYTAHNMFLGKNSGVAIGTGTGNTALGENSQLSMSSGADNTSLGYNALKSNDASQNVAIGSGALENVTGTSQNTAVGTFALNDALVSFANVAIGMSAGDSNNTATTKNRNVFIGTEAGYGTDSVDDNVFIGYQAGNATTTGDANILIGSGINAPSGASSNYLNLGGAFYGSMSAKSYAVNGSLEVKEAFSLSGDNPGPLTANTNDWAPANLATSTVLRATATAPVDLTGLAGGVDGRIISIMNVGANAITLKNGDAASAAANRFALTGDLKLNTNQTVVLMYDSTSGVWRQLANSMALGTGAAAAGLNGEIQFNSGGALGADSNLFWDNTNKAMGIGATPFDRLLVAVDDSDFGVSIQNSSSTGARTPHLNIYNYTGGNGGYSALNLAAARGSSATPAAVQSGDVLGIVGGYGQYDTTANHFGVGSLIRFSADGNFTGTSTPGSIAFGTTAVNAVGPAEHMKITSGGLVDIEHAVAFSGDAPGSLTADTNDWAPANFATSTVLRATATAPVNLTGLAGGTDGRVVSIMNVGANKVTLKNNDSASAVGNRFAFTGDLPLATNQTVVLMYDSTASVWRQLANSMAMGSAATAAGSANEVQFRDTVTGTLDADSTYVYNKTNHRLGVGTATPSGTLSVAGTATDNAYFFYDNADVADGTDGQSIYLYRRGSTDSSLQMYIDQYREGYFKGDDQITHFHIGTSATSSMLDLQDDVDGDITMFDRSISGRTRSLFIAGFRASDALRYLDISVGSDAANTASFKGLGNYYFDGNIGIKTTAPNATLDNGGSTALSGDIPGALAANTDNWAPANLATATVIRVDASAPVNLTGLTGGVDGRVLTLSNVGANAVILKAEDAASTGANRFALTGDLTLAPNQNTVLMYDSTSNRWRQIANSLAGGSITFPLLANPKGTPTAPAYSFQGDSDTGMFSDTLDTLEFTAGGIEAFELGTVASGVNYIRVIPAITGVAPTITNAGANTSGAGLGVNVTGRDATASGNGGPVTLTGGAAFGANAGGAINLIGGAPAATAGSIGGAINLAAGDGATTGTGAVGGAVVITGGDGHGSANNQGGAITMRSGNGVNLANGGTTTITTGTGGANGNGGTLSLRTGNSGGTGAGGTVNITSGTGNGGGVGNTGGPINITAGNSIGSGSAPGAAVTITGGNAAPTAASVAAGGAVVLQGGVGAPQGPGGAITLTAGTGGTTSGAGGAINLNGGIPTAGAGGSINITAAAGIGTDKNGGDITVTAGAPTGTGTPGFINLASGIKFSNDILGSIGANTNDWNPAGLSGASVIRIDASAAYNITGLAGGVDGRIMTLTNVGTFAVTLKNSDAGSAAANQFALPGDLLLTPKQTAVLMYDSTANVWRQLANSLASGTGDNLGNHIATQNIQLGSNWLSGDGGNEGIQVNSTGKVGVNTAPTGYSVSVGGDIHLNGSVGSLFTNYFNTSQATMNSISSFRINLDHNNDETGTFFKVSTNSAAAANAVGGNDLFIVTDTGTTEALGTFQFDGAIYGTGDISPAQLTANTNNWNPTGLAGASVIRIDANPAINLTGLAGGADGRIITLINVGAQNITLKANSGSSTVGNQFALPGDVVLTPNQTVIMMYDATGTGIWRQLANSLASGTGDNLGNHIATQNIQLGSNWLSGDGGNEGLLINSIGNVGIGGNAWGAAGQLLTLQGTDVATSFNVVNGSSTAARYPNIGIYNYTGGFGGSTALSFYNGRGTVGTSAPVQSGDYLGLITFEGGYNATNDFGEGAYIASLSESTFASNNYTGNLIFYTNGGSAGATERLRIGANGLVSVANSFALTGDVPGVLAGNTDDWAPANLATAAVIRASAPAAYNVTGLTGGVDGRFITIFNTGTFNITLKKDNGSASTAANRFALTSDLVLTPNQNAILMYDATAQRWRSVGADGGTATAAGSNTHVQYNNNGILGADAGFTYTSGTQTMTIGSGITFGSTAGAAAPVYSELWSQGTGDKIYYNTGTPQVGIGNTSPNYTLDVTGTANISGTTQLAGALNLSGSIIGSLTGNTNNWAPAGLSGASVIRATASGAYNLTGLTGGVDGRVITIVNTGANTITLKNNSGSSTATNKFSMPADVALATNQSVVLMYDSAAGVWRQLANSLASGTGDNLGNHTATQNIQLGANWLSGDGGNEGIRVDSNGKVGVGAAPTGTVALEVTPTGVFDGVLVNRSGTGTANAGAWAFAIANAANTDYMFFGQTSTTYTTGGTTAWAGNDKSVLYYPTELRIGTNPAATAPVMTMTSAGDVGIGIAPTSRFEVLGPDTTGGNDLTILNAHADVDVGGGANIRIANDNANDHQAQVNFQDVWFMGNSSSSNTTDDFFIFHGGYRPFLIGTDNLVYLNSATAFSSDISPAQITANQNDYNPADLATASVLRLSSDASRNITSLAGGADGRIITIMNIGSFPIVLKNDDGATGTAANRFALTGDLTLAAKQSAILMYDATALRWRQVANGVAAGGGDNLGNHIATQNMLWNVGPAYNDNMMYLLSGTSGPVDGSMGFFAAGMGSSSANDGAYFLARGNDFSAIAGQRGNMFFSAGKPSSPAAGEGSLNFMTEDITRIFVAADGRISMSSNYTGAGYTNYGFHVYTGNDSSLITADNAGGIAATLYVGNNAPAANGNGSNLGFTAHGSASTNTEFAGISMVVTDKTQATASGDLIFNTAGPNSSYLSGEKMRLTSTGQLNIQNGLALQGDIAGALATSTNDWAPANFAYASIIRMTSTGNVNLTGLAGGTDGRVITLMNVDSADTITLKNNSGSSSAGNKFSLTGDLALAPNQSAILIYDSTSSVWRQVANGTASGGTVSAAGSNTQIQYNNGGILGASAGFTYDATAGASAMALTDTHTGTAGTGNSLQTLTLQVAPTANQSANRIEGGIYSNVNVPNSNAFTIRKIQGISSDIGNDGTGSVEALQALVGWAQNTGNAAVSYIVGGYSGGFSSNGTVGSMSGLNAEAYVAGGAVTDMYGVNVFTSQATGTVTNRYGVYLASPAGAATAKDFGFYQAGTQQNYLGGALGIGDDAIASDAKLQIDVAQDNYLVMSQSGDDYVKLGRTDSNGALLSLSQGGVEQLHLDSRSGYASFLPGPLEMHGDINAALAANTDNWNPTDLANAAVVRMTSTGNVNLTGLQGGADGRIITLMNVDTADTITLKNSTTSTAAYQFAMTADLALAPNETATLMYDSTASRWKLLAKGSAAGGAAIGIDALSDAVYDITVDHNMVLGSNTAPTTGAIQNLWIGEGAGNSTTNGADYNVAIGYHALTANTTGYSNVAVGASAGAGISTGQGIVAIGYNALSTGSTSTGTYNTAIGMNAMGGDTVTGNYNVAIGPGSLFRNTSGANNVAVGDNTLVYSTTGGFNTVMGSGAMYANATGSYNTVLGQAAGTFLKGSANTVVGAGAANGAGDYTGNYNTVIGNGSGSAFATGADYNIILGYTSGTTITTGTNNILIGNSVQTPGAASTYALNIGDTIKGDLSTRYTTPTGGFGLISDISPAQITANQNDYNPATLANAAVLRLNSDASRDITGLQGGSDGRIITIMNVGSFPIVLKNNSASSSAGNKFLLTGDLTLASNQSAILMYDSTLTVWRQIANGTATGSGDNLGNHIATANIQLGANWLSGDGGNEGIFVDSSGRVGVNTNTNLWDMTVSGTDKSTTLQIKNTSSTAARYPQLYVTNYTGGNGGWADMVLYTARGNETTPAAVQQWDQIGQIEFQGHDGTNSNIEGADIAVGAAQNWTTSARGTYMVFRTIANGTTSGADRVTIDGNGSLNLGYGFALQGDIAGALTANTDNWAPTNLANASVIRITSNGAYNITGLTGGADGRVITLMNTSAYTITLKSDTTTTSSAANRFRLTGDLALAPNQNAVLVYDSTASRWRSVGADGGNATAAGANTQVQYNNSGALGADANFTWTSGTQTLGVGGGIQLGLTAGAAAPTLTGLWQQGTGNIIYYNTGTPQVGIGTTSPGHPLHVVASSNAASPIGVQNTAANGWSEIEFEDNNGTAQGWIGYANSGTVVGLGSRSSVFYVVPAINGDTIVGDVDGTGKVGIGTYNPVATLDAGKSIAFSGDINGALATSTNDWAPTGLATASVIRMTSAGNVNLTGLTGGADGRIITLMNVDTADTITLKNASASSAAGNKFALTGDLALAPNQSVILMYDSVSSPAVWRQVSNGTATGSGDNLGNHIATTNIQLGSNWLSGDGGAEGIMVNSIGNVGIGSSPWGAAGQLLTVQGVDVSASLNLVNQSSTAARYPGMGIYNYTGGNGGAAGVNFFTGRGTIGTSAAVQANDSLGEVNFNGAYNNANGMGNGASIGSFAESTYASNNYTGNLVFYTNSGAATATERLRIGANGLVSVANGFALTGDTSPTALAANTNDWAPANFATNSIIRASASGAARDLTGIAGGTDGRVISIMNVGSYTITLKNDSASSAAGNKFKLTGDLVLAPNQNAILVYDATAPGYWRSIGSDGGNATPGGANTNVQYNNSGALAGDANFTWTSGTGTLGVSGGVLLGGTTGAAAPVSNTGLWTQGTGNKIYYNTGTPQVGIGLTAPAYTLDMTGKAHFTPTDTGGLSLILDKYNSTEGGDMWFNDNTASWDIDVNSGVMRFNQMGANLGSFVATPLKLDSTGVILNSAVARTGRIDAALASSTNDWAPAGLASASVIRMTSTGNVNLTGLTGGADGRIITLMNVDTADTITLKNSVTSTAANQFLFGADLALAINETATIMYDSTALRWKLLAKGSTAGGTASAAGSTTQIQYNNGGVLGASSGLTYDATAGASAMTLSGTHTGTTGSNTYSLGQTMLTVAPTANQSAGRVEIAQSTNAGVGAGNTFTIRRIEGLDSNVSNAGTGSVESLQALTGWTQNSGNAAVTAMTGGYAGSSTSAGTIASMSGLNAEAYVSGGTVTNMYGINVYMSRSAGTVTNRYGMFISNPTGSATNDWGFYQAGAQKNYFGGSLITSGDLLLDGALYLTEELGLTIATSQNNYAPSGISTASILRLNPTANVDITGITADTDNRFLPVMNVNATNTVTFKNNSASSSAGNKFAMGADVALGPNQSAVLVYDLGATAWRIIGAPGLGGAGDNLGNHTATQNVQLGSYYLSGDGGSEGVSVDSAGKVTVSSSLKFGSTAGASAPTGLRVQDLSDVTLTSIATNDVLKWNGSAWVNSAGGGGGADNLGNHTATQNIQLGTNWLSGDGGNEGIKIDSAGIVTVNSYLTIGTGGDGNVNLQQDQYGNFSIFSQAGRLAFGVGQSNSTSNNMVVITARGDDSTYLGMSVGDFGAHDPNATFDNYGSTAFSGSIAPTALAANTNNWNPTDLKIATVIRAQASAAVDLTGIVAGGNGRMITIENVGSTYTITLKNNVTSTAANRFLMTGDLALAPNQTATFIYDTTAATNTGRWRLIANGSTTGGGGTPGGANTQIQFNNSGAFGGSSNLTWNGTTFAVTGDITYSGTITDISDMRLKKNIKPLDQADVLSKLAQVNTYTFNMKDDPKNQTEYGVMAQEVEKLFPDLVKTANDEMGTKSVNYTGFIAPLIESSKALKAENDNLKAQIAELKSERAETDKSLEDIRKEINGMKAYTGYGTRKAEMGVGMLLGMGATITLLFAFGGIIRIRRRDSK